MENSKEIVSSLFNRSFESEYEYEFVDIQIISDLDSIRILHDDSEIAPKPIQYDENGIPMGQSMEEIRLRQEIVKAFYNEWLRENPEASVENDSLKDKIYVSPISIGEAMEHSSKTYQSTLTITHLTEVLQKSRPVCRVPIKVGNSRQSKFEYMLIMTYELPEIGKIKLTVGIQKKTERRVEYGLTALREGEPLVNHTIKGKASHKK